jgi:deoxyribonuclease-4
LARIPAKAAAITAECVQIFVSAPQNWRPPTCSDAEVDAFRAAVAALNIGPVLIHGIYLLNPASTDELLVQRTIDSIACDLGWADRIGALGVVIHLGSSGADPMEVGLERAGGRLREAMARHEADAWLLLETCAGQGNTLGCRFDQLGYLLDRIGDERAGICLDTCHAFAAGYDLTTDEGLAATVGELDRFVGLSRLKAIHANDSKMPLGSNRDRHANIGEGFIGEAGFRRVLRHPALVSLPLFLEVPGSGEGPDAENLNALRRLAGVRRKQPAISAAPPAAAQRSRSRTSAPSPALPDHPPFPAAE